ncbi:MAG: carbohydrate kinase family protein [Burkholderiales bacterium]|nr:carbohydrate kinase family protein [Anaerolineae bacterium]
MFVVVGTTTIDLFTSGMENLPRIDGDEFTSSSLAFCSRPTTLAIGGNGANSAYVFARLGVETALCSAAGVDFLGDVMAGWLSEKGVDLRGLVRVTTHGTATNSTIMDEALNRLSFYYPGALHDLTYEHFPVAMFEQAKTLLITGPALLPSFRGKGIESALKAAHEQGAVTALDIGPMIGTPVTLDEIAPLLASVDYLIANEYELTICAGDSDAENGIQHLLNAGARAVVLKRGKDGATVYHNGQRFDAPGFPVKANVTIGAGDSFNSGFLFALDRGDDLQAAATFGSATASIVVASGKSVLGSPTVEQVAALIQKGSH